MPFIAVVIPNIRQEEKDNFLASWPAAVAAMKANPLVQGVSGGLIVAEDGAPVTDFKFMEIVGFKTLEDSKAFSDSDYIKEATKKYEALAAGPAQHDLFEISEPPQAAPSPLTVVTYTTIDDESKEPEVLKAWEAASAGIGKKAFGGKTAVPDGPRMGIAMVGWESKEEIEAAVANPATKAAWDYYNSLGKVKNLVVKLENY
ncbi:hypothetical protein LZ554_005454 [Drepanopeziza brunnea f. sp. 'monogermtubi']|nr:hypothetical protein LZ554_005454 [Drepanopeziza brunnea f. sp. 'monogermtubi']